MSYSRSKKSGTTSVQIRRQVNGLPREAVMASIMEQIRRHSDLHSDVFFAMEAQLLKGEKDEDGNTWITADQILDYRGIERKKNKDGSSGGHHWERIEEIARIIKDFESIYICISEQEVIDDSAPASQKRKRGKATISRESRLFMFGDILVDEKLTFDNEP